MGAPVVSGGYVDAPRAPVSARRPPGAPASVPPPPGAVRTLEYVPALDGLRAVALFGVLAFHQRFAWAPGGFLGVSTFFTLSGFLIARLALAERGRTGGLSLAGFWERRARRLLPAALVTVAGVAAVAATTGIGGPAVRGDLLASLAYVANWRFVATSGDYANLFTDPSPVAHMWSLAVEEQFYLLFPLAFVLVTRGGRALRRGAAAWGVAAAGCFALAWWVARGSNTGLAYYATFTRAGEVLVGVVAAYAAVNGPGRRLLAGRAGRVARGGAAVATPLALLALAALWHATTLGSPGLFRGVTALNAGLTAVLVLAVTLPAGGADAGPPGARSGGPLARVLGAWPLRSIGKVSYGAYLLHWPVFLVLDAGRTHVDRPERLFALRLAVTLALAAVSYVLVESPVRFRARVSRRRLAGGFGTVGVAVAALVVVVPIHATSGHEVGVAGPGSGSANGWTVPTTGPVASRVLLLGDSVAWSMGPSFSAWNKADPDRQVAVKGYTPFGCPLGGHEVPLRIFGGVWAPWDACLGWHAALPEVVAGTDADVVVFTSGVFELGERRLGGRWVHIGQPAYDRWLKDRLSALADLLATPGVPVLWTTFPHVRLHDPADPTRPWDGIDSNDPERVDRLNELVREVVAGRPGFRVVDLERWTEGLPGGEFDESQRDGTHYSWGAAKPLGAWLVPQVLAATAR